MAGLFFLCCRLQPGPREFGGNLDGNAALEKYGRAAKFDAALALIVSDDCVRVINTQSRRGA
jgi:hypothetical protein